MKKAKCISLTEEMYWYLIERKFRLRAHSVDEVLRMDLQDLPASLRGRTTPQVKLYGWELGHPAMMDDTPEPGDDKSSLKTAGRPVKVIV